jgi:hypothetical protein
VAVAFHQEVVEVVWRQEEVAACCLVAGAYHQEVVEVA